MKIDWVKYERQGKLPLERRSVLVMIDRRQSDICKQSRWMPGADSEFKDTAATVAVGYVRVHSGGPFFVVPGVTHKDEEITHWADCLGDTFNAPLWQSKQVCGTPRRQWDNHLGHINEVTSEERFGS